MAPASSSTAQISRYLTNAYYLIVAISMIKRLFLLQRFIQSMVRGVPDPVLAPELPMDDNDLEGSLDEWNTSVDGDTPTPEPEGMAKTRPRKRKAGFVHKADDSSLCVE
jgi:hypothetical protein